MLERRPALGKGLSALIPDAPEPARSGPIEIDIDLLAPNQQQPRLNMDDGKLEELAASIKANGIIQPILVRRTGNTYRIIAGERRWRAAQKAGLQRVPVVVRDVADGDKQLLELALVENLQREGLNPIDEALAYQRLADEFSLTQEQIAAAVGKDRELGRQLHAAVEAARGSARRSRVRRSFHGSCPRAVGASRRGGAAARCARGDLASPLGSRNRGARQETVVGQAANAIREWRVCPHLRRAYQGGGGPDALRSGHESPHQPARLGRATRNRVRVGRRTEPDIRGDHQPRLTPSPGASAYKTPRFPWYK